MLTAADDFSLVPPFEIRAGDGQAVPFVFNSPHSGRHYPERFLRMSRLDGLSIRRSEDTYVDELFGVAPSLGAPLLVANFPRAYLDVNREPWELDPKMFAEPLPPFANIRSARVAGGLGTLAKVVGEGLEIYSARLPLSEAVGRIETIYEPYHRTLKQLLGATHGRFGWAVLIDCHSMPASIRLGDAGFRPDFIIGDRFGASAAAELTQTAIGLLSGMGYRVTHNKPYAGGFITEHYGRPARGVHALQIEINRALYMNEKTLARTGGFDALAGDLSFFAARLIAQTDLSPGLPMAAE
jgi:N-formylglutamate amidohydrolase